MVHIKQKFNFFPVSILGSWLFPSVRKVAKLCPDRTKDLGVYNEHTYIKTNKTSILVILDTMMVLTHDTKCLLLCGCLSQTLRYDCFYFLLRIINRKISSNMWVCFLFIFRLIKLKSNEFIHNFHIISLTNSERDILTLFVFFLFVKEATNNEI